MQEIAQQRISIHALLAESDEILYILCWEVINFYPRSPCGERPFTRRTFAYVSYFYPRSPCGERLILLVALFLILRFLSTLSLRRATQKHINSRANHIISIHALLAESDIVILRKRNTPSQFLSTLSLRRATEYFLAWHCMSEISIHALLAESDGANSHGGRQGQHISIHALLAESDVKLLLQLMMVPLFLSTLSLRRATAAGRFLLS